ncbi:MAG TPA: tail fiber domain-containing protein [Xanthobacteraceae bacterium]|nr:tail fiber domain-containing protein [Xanthobacteraceae bacterium]
MNSALAGVDARKRAALTRLLAGTAFVAPVVASYAIDALSISKARAVTANGSGINISDRRLKTGIKRLATLPSGVGLYRFRYVWSDTEYVGVIAQEVRELMPQAVVEGADGFLRVDYEVLGLEMQTYADWQKREAARAPAIAA